jgi:hypothetical protein
LDSDCVPLKIYMLPLAGTKTTNRRNKLCVSSFRTLPAMAPSWCA